MVLAAALVVIGGVGPWLRIRGVDVEFFGTDRAVASVAAGLGTAIAWIARPPFVRPGVAVCGLVCLGVTGYRFLDLSVELSQVGWGLWVALAGSVALLVSAARA